MYNDKKSRMQQLHMIYFLSSDIQEISEQL